jgi:glycosyltransferase involved in cell wall biosynthesis
MIKILHLLDLLRRGGKERQFIELLRGIDKTKYQIHTVVLEKRTDGYDNEAKNLSHSFVYMPRRFRWDLLLVLDLIKYCKKNQIEVIHVWDGMCAFYALFTAWFSGVKFINGSIRDADPRRSYRHIVKNIVLKLSKHIVANQYAGLKVYGVEKKGKVIYNGLDFERFTNFKKTKNRNFVIGIVANLTEYKDYYTFFKAIKILQEKVEKFEVQIIGGGKLTQTYKDYAIQIGVDQSILKYFGRVTNTENLIPNFDVGVLCSYKTKGEGLSNSVIEYMACSVPPIITDIGAAREIVEEGVTGLLFEPEDGKNLADKIKLLIDNEKLRLEIGERAKKVVFEKFSYERYIQESEEYYSKIAAER